MVFFELTLEIRCTQIGNVICTASSLCSQPPPQILPPAFETNHILLTEKGNHISIIHD